MSLLPSLEEAALPHEVIIPVWRDSASYYQVVVAPLSGRAVLPCAGLSELTVPGIHDDLGFWAMPSFQGLWHRML